MMFITSMTNAITGPKKGKVITGIISSLRKEVLPERIKNIHIIEHKT
jgi:hypothetical protein